MGRVARGPWQWGGPWQTGSPFAMGKLLCRPLRRAVGSLGEAAGGAWEPARLGPVGAPLPWRWGWTQCRCRPSAGRRSPSLPHLVPFLNCINPSTHSAIFSRGPTNSDRLAGNLVPALTVAPPQIACRRRCIAVMSCAIHINCTAITNLTIPSPSRLRRSSAAGAASPPSRPRCRRLCGASSCTTCGTLTSTCCCTARTASTARVSNSRATKLRRSSDRWLAGRWIAML